MGDIIKLIYEYPESGKTGTGSGIWMAGRIWNCEIVWTKDNDDSREIYQRIEQAILQGQDSLTTKVPYRGTVTIDWVIRHPWEIDE